MPVFSGARLCTLTRPWRNCPGSAIAHAFVAPGRNRLDEFVSLAGFRNCAVGDKPNEFRIPFIAQVAQGAPEFHRPQMVMFDERGKSLGPSCKKLSTYLAH